VREETKWSPVSSRVKIVRCCADWPDAVAIAPMPFSRAAMRSSNTAVVGFMIRE
jgi:hypothetical protein